MLRRKRAGYPQPLSRGEEPTPFCFVIGLDTRNVHFKRDGLEATKRRESKRNEIDTFGLYVSELVFSLRAWVIRRNLNCKAFNIRKSAG
jgi:hypothetical protein